MLSDFQSAWRYVRSQPGFSLLAILSLAVAIGVNAAMFSVVSGFLLRDAVPEDPARYVGVFTTTQDAARTYRPFSLAEFEALRADKTVFADVSAVYYSQVALGAETDARRAFAFLVSGNFFSLAGAQPAAGRFFTPEEAAAGSDAAVVVASQRLWRAHGGGADLVGSTLRVNGRECTVIGIAPEGFSGASPLLAPEIWLPLGFFAQAAPAFSALRSATDLAAPHNFQLQLFARLQPTLSRTTVQPLLPVLARRLAALEPEATPRELVLARPFGIAPEPARESAFGPLTGLTLGFSALVLVAACLNLGNLLLVRGTTRAAEMATRLALGASRARLIRQLLAEGLLLGGAGALLGLVCSLWAGTFLAQVLADRVAEFGFTVVAAFQPDGAVLAATALVSLLACLAFSLGPALRASRVDLAHALRSGASGVIAGAGRTRWSGRNLLLVGQTALSFVLLFVAALFLRSALAAAEPPRGIDLAGRAVAEIDFSLAPTARTAPRARLLDALDAARRAPGIAHAGITSLLPYANDVQIFRARPSLPGEAAAGPVVGAFAAVSDGYVETIARLLRGRDFTRAEAASPESAPVCLVDEQLAHRLFPHRDALGETIELHAGPLNGRFTIVGLTSAHSQDVADRANPFPRVFVPLARVERPLWFVVARGAAGGAGADLGAAHALETALRAADAELPLLPVRTLRDFVDGNFGRWQAALGAALFGFFALVSVALAAVGVYGVTAYATARRTREIGVRMALGATRADIARLVLRGGLGQLAAAFAGGSLLALAAGPLLALFVPNVRALDPAAFALAVGTLLLAAAVALAAPARRAARIDPLVALRSE